MHRWACAAAAAVVLTCVAAPAAAAKQRPADRLEVYTAVTSADKLAELEAAGIDVADSENVGSAVKAQLIMTADQRAKAAAAGVKTKLTRVKGGKTVKQFAAAQAANGFNVWRSYDEPGGFRDQMYKLAKDNPQITKLVKLGTTLQGREILALKVTQGARGQRDGSRPAVLFSATQHAREWIAAEMDRRLMHRYVNRYRSGDKATKDLLKSTELWFVPVMNPDGYQYTFGPERLWRKNMRDNDGDGVTTISDGVDPNRNYPEHWKYDEEGSSKIFSSQTYRGPAPASEAETKAMQGLLGRVQFAFQVNYHSAGEWLLYPEGWQVGSPTADDPIYFALSGNLDRAAIAGYHPGLSSDVLYVTNGEANDYSHNVGKTLAWTPELAEGCDGCGFVFPDDEALVQAEFERNLPFAESVAKSAQDPDDPKSSLGIKTKPFYIRSDDPYKAGVPGANFAFPYSYGDPQPVQVLAKRALGSVTAKYRINGGAVRSASTSEWRGGERYRPASVHYHVMRGTVTGTSPGDSVEVWFEGGGQRSESFTYQAVNESNRRMLVVSAEDYSGASPVQAPGPHYLQYYLDALAANGVSADVYDVDARGRNAPDQLGVLSHYDGVIWYTGDDIVTRKAGWPGGNADRLALDEMLEARAYMDEGGRVLYTGKRAGQQYTGAGVGTQFYDPKNEGPCSAEPAVGSAAVPAAARIRVRRRPRQRRARVLVRRLQPGRRRRHEPERRAVRGRGHRRPVRRAALGLRRPRQREQPGQQLVVRDDERHPAGRRVPAVHELAVVPVGQAGRPVRAAHRRPLRVLADRRRHVQAADTGDPGAGRRRQPEVLDLLRHRGALGLPDGRGPDRGRQRLDDAAGRQRPHVAGHGRQLPGGVVRAAPVPRALPDVPRHGAADLRPDRDVGRVERGVGQLPGLAGVVDRPGGVRRQDGGDLHRLHQRLERAEPRRVPGRHHAAGRHDRRRSRPTPAAGRSPARRRAAGRTRTTGPSPTPVASRSARRSRRPSRS